MRTATVFFASLGLVLVAYFFSYRFMFDDSTGIKTDWFNQREAMLILATAFFGFGIPIYLVLTKNYTTSIPRLVASITTTIATAGLLVWTALSLGRNYSPTLQIQEKHTLVTAGPYKYVRHPMYSAFLLWFISQSLLVPDVSVPTASAVAAVLLLFQRIPAEEILLMREFGEGYKKYKAKTANVIPVVY